MGLSMVKDFSTMSLVVLMQYQHVTDRQTDTRFTISILRFALMNKCGRAIKPVRNANASLYGGLPF